MRSIILNMLVKIFLVHQTKTMTEQVMLKIWLSLLSNTLKKRLGLQLNFNHLKMYGRQSMRWFLMNTFKKENIFQMIIYINVNNIQINHRSSLEVSRWKPNKLVFNVYFYRLFWSTIKNWRRRTEVFKNKNKALIWRGIS